MKNIKSFFKSKSNVRLFIIVVILISLAVGFFVYQIFKDRVFIDNSIIDTPIVNISTQKQGLLTDLFAIEGKNIHKGDVVGLVGGETVVSNTDGLVIFTNKQIGSTVNALTTLIQIIVPSEMRIAGTIDENKGLNLISIGQVVSFTVDALPGKTFWGFVDEISPSAKQTQLAFSISSERPTQQFVVYAKFNAMAYPDIKNGMSAKMTIYTKTY